MPPDWRNWTYEEWNRRLIDYCLPEHADQAGHVERIPATPEELVRIAGDPDAVPGDVVDVFVAQVKEQVPINRLSFCGFCSEYRGWTPESAEPPHFFAMLWLTCLIAYGYPDDVRRFDDRLATVFGRRQNPDCLVQLWSDLAKWVNEGGGRAGSRQRLRLPPPDEYRSNIGASWFLAFPHQHDRHRLRNLLVREDLVGEEPPIAPVIDTLLRSESIFSQAFRDDLAHFVEKFLRAGGDARSSAFWRAVRQEALAPDEQERCDSNATLAVLGYPREDEFVVHLACTAEAELPSGFSSSPMSGVTDGMSHYVLYERGGGPGTSAMDAATIEVLEGRLHVPRASHHVTRGVLVFQEAVSGDYRLVAGADANEADVAFVRSDRVEAFARAYRGNALESRFLGWYEVVDCEVIVRRELPIGLEGVVHLQETMVPPMVRLAGGIRTAEGFLAYPGFLPRVRFDGATAVELVDAQGRQAGSAHRVEPGGSEWELPDRLAAEAPSHWLLRVRWDAKVGVERTTEAEVVLLRAQVRFDYKCLGAGTFDVESCTPGEVEIEGGTDVPLGLEAGALDEPGPDLLDLEAEARYLGPGFGEFSLTPIPGFDWCVVGPRNSPNTLVFIGDLSAPTPPAARRSADRGAGRHWRKAVSNPAREGRAFVRLPDGRLVTLEDVPGVARMLREYQRHDPGDDAPACEEFAGNSSEAHRWCGVVPDARVGHFVDALAALSVRRSGVRYQVLLDLLSSLTSCDRRADKVLSFDLVRAFAESGAIDVAHAQGRRATYVIARRPFFVAHRVANRVRASLLGLVPPSLAEHVRRAVRERGGRFEDVLPTCKWLPGVIRVACEGPDTLRSLSADLDLDEPRWLRWPLIGPGGVDLRADDQGLHEGPPHESFATEAVWDWDAARFESARSGWGAYTKTVGVAVERRSHRERCAVYVVLLDGAPWAWTHVRNWALLFAYGLRDGYAPFESRVGEPITRTARGGVYMPLPLGRLCAVLGDGLSGPILGADESSVVAYRYPIVNTFRERFGSFVPVRPAEPERVASA